MRVLVTGAAGFLGSALVRSLLDDGTSGGIVGLDLAAPPPGIAGSRVQFIAGRIDDPDCLASVTAQPFDTVFHLASVPGALAEREPELGRRVNLDATLDLFDRVAAAGNRPRVVFASSIAVYGPLGSDPVDASAPARPATSYGTHKRMAELALADLTRKGLVSGISLRLPGLVARPGTSSGHGSAFMSDLLRVAAAGKAYSCPVGPDAACWWMSVSAAVANLRHAGAVTATGDIQLPALHLSVGDVIRALEDATGQERMGKITFAPDAAIERIFGRFPALLTPEAEALGFASDGTPAQLVAAALAAS